MNKNESRKIKIFKKIIIIFLANFLCSIAINVFFIPSNLLSGGIGGIGIMFQYLTGIPTGYFVFGINLPLFLIAYNRVDKEFASYGFISMIVFSFILTVTKDLGKIFILNDILIGAIFGGVLNGLGVGLLFKYLMCQDGLDIIAAVLKRKYNIKIGSSLMAVNSTIVIISSLIFSFNLAMYTVIAIFINSKVLDKVKSGFNEKKSVFIISEHYEEVAKKLEFELKRSLTFIEGMGSYKREKMKIIYIIITANEVVKLKNYVEEVDSKAFIIIKNVIEAKGSNFENNFI